LLSLENETQVTNGPDYQASAIYGNRVVKEDGTNQGVYLYDILIRSCLREAFAIRGTRSSR